MKKILALSIVCIMILSFSVQAFAISFSDVAENAWYYTFVNDLASKGVINGYPDGTFNPDGKVTVAEFIKLIITASNPDIKYDLIDARFNHWAAKYVRVAENVGVFEKDEYTINDMDREISRIEIVRILARCDIMIKGSAQTTSYKQFSDIDGISANDRIYLGHAVGIGVINGDPGGTFRPNDSLLRSECAKVIYTYTNR